MKRIKLLLVLALTIIVCCACGSSTTGNLESNDTEHIMAETNETESINDVIDGYKKAVYEDYNYHYSGRDKDGEMIYVEGTVVEYIDYNATLAFILEETQGNRWIVGMGKRPLYSLEKVKELIGKELRVFGGFGGFSEVYELPGVYEDIKIQFSDEEKATLFAHDFIADREEFILWFEENPNEILYTERKDEERTGTFASSTGIVEKVDKYSDYWLDFYQKTEDGYESQFISFSDIYYDEAQSLFDFSVGDGVRLYYYIDAESDITLMALEKIETDFSLDDIEADFKNKCKEYTYEEIARNPESVKRERAKVTGEVIQVLESYGYTYLRVNITKNKYGNYKDTIYVSYKPKTETEDRILEDDIITIYGILSGTETYTSVLGVSVTLPRINGEYIEILPQ